MTWLRVKDSIFFVPPLTYRAALSHVCLQRPLGKTFEVLGHCQPNHCNDARALPCGMLTLVKCVTQHIVPNLSSLITVTVHSYRLRLMKWIAIRFSSLLNHGWHILLIDLCLKFLFLICYINDAFWRLIWKKAF